MGNLDLAEDSLQTASVLALETWPTSGIPSNPRAWLVSTARFKGIDAIRRSQRMVPMDHALNVADEKLTPQLPEESLIADDRLGLIFVCCHPALSPEGRVALTLREVCGLTTDEIAHAFLVPPPTVYQRIVRAKTKILDERIGYEIPDQDAWPERMGGVLAVAYLLFNEGYFATTGNAIVRPQLTEEAIRLTRLLVELVEDAEVMGLLALMLLQDARLRARTADDELVLFEEQKQEDWDSAQIKEGLELVDRALKSASPGTYTLQAAIVAQHVGGALAGTKNWHAILDLYDQLQDINPSAVVRLNRAVAVAKVRGFDEALQIVDEILGGGELGSYGLAHSTRAEFCRQLGLFDEAKSSLQKALDLTEHEGRRRFLEHRLQEISQLF